MAHHRFAAPRRELLGQRLARAQPCSGGDDDGGATGGGRARSYAAGNRLPSRRQFPMCCLFFRHNHDEPASHSPQLEPDPVGPVQIDCPVILAPMTGVTDLPFRRLVRRLARASTSPR
jgi:hypothetical protein